MSQTSLEKSSPMSILEKLSLLEEEISNLKKIIQIKMHKKTKIKSLEGIGKILVSEAELEKAIGEAQKSLAKGI